MKNHSVILTGLDKPAVIDAQFCDELNKLFTGIGIHDKAVLVTPIRDDLGSDFNFHHQHMRMLKFVKLLFGMSQPFVVAMREFVAIFKQLCLFRNRFRARTMAIQRLALS